MSATPEQVAVWREAVAARPEDPATHCGLATALWRAGQHAESTECLRRALALDARHIEALAGLGHALSAFGAFEEAAQHYRAAIALAPDQAELRASLGNALMRLDRPQEAETAYRAALARRPDHAGALNNLGNALRSLGRHEEALAQYHQALAQQPQQWGTRNNIASALLALHRPAEAESWLRPVLQALPDYAEAANNLGGALLAQDRLEEAASWFQHASTLDPGLAHARLGLAMALLGQGDFPRGWAAYESRWQDPRFLAEELLPAITLPRWLGEPTRVLLTAEQGLGDTIQFSRLAAQVTARGADAVLAVQPTLVRLLQGLAPRVVAIGADTSGCTAHCPLMSLPHALGLTLEAIPPPQLVADPALVAQWHETLSPRTRTRIGLALSGSHTHAEDAQRSIPAARFADLFTQIDAEWHLLQPDPRPDDQASLSPVRQHGHALTDFAETAALASLMDLVITVDTSVAHLAASLNQPTWILLHHTADWRWLRHRADSPWYPSARLFRQTRPGDWPGVLDAVRLALSAR